VHYALVPDQTELRLATAGCVSNHRNGPRWGYGRDVGVANFETFLPLTTALPGWVSPALLCQLRALTISYFLNEFHYLSAPFPALRFKCRCRSMEPRLHDS